MTPVLTDSGRILISMKPQPLPPSLLAATLVLSVVAASSANAQVLLARYSFDEGTGTTAADSVSPAASLTLGGTSTWSSNTPGGAGFSFSTNGGAVANHAAGADADKVDGLTQLTLTGWFNLQSAPSVNDRIISDRASISGATNNGFELIFSSASTLQLIADGLLLDSGTASFTTNTWVFFAATYDGLLTSNNVAFYTGSVSATALQLGSVGTINSGALLGNPVGTRIGGVDTSVTANDRTPNALFDDIRIYNGVLDLAAIQAVQASAIPEPSAYAAVLAGAAGLMATQRRRRPAR